LAKSAKESASRRRRKKLVPNKVRWNSDVIVDLMRQYDFPFVPLNPGASFRGLHDSMVNYGQDDPQMILCPHENIAIQMAHGYAKATGEPLPVILHNVVGLLHACMAVYYAYIDRAPIFIIGATGPMDAAVRRPRTDWIHTANVQGNAIRDYTKWDDQPHTIDAVPESFARAYSVMMTEPQGPVYTCYDATLLETKLPREVALPDPAKPRVPTRMAPDPAALVRVADMLAAAKNPILIADWTCRAPIGYDDLVDLAESLSAGVIDVGARFNFPTRHPLNMTQCAAEALKTADLILCLDTRDSARITHVLDSVTRKIVSKVPKSAKWIDISFGELEISSWSTDFGPLKDADIRILADTSLAIPELTRLVRRRLTRSRVQGKAADTRAKKLTKLHNEARARNIKRARENWDAKPMATARLASEVWDAIKDEDWVLTAGNCSGWTHRLWDFDKPYRYPGSALGTATQIGISLGVALAHRNKGRLVVDIQPDGDLMFDPGALWVAAKYKIPMLVVMYNNRAYYNDWEHQIRMARHRGTPVERAYIGMDIVKPEIDFAGLARSMGWYAEDRVELGKDLGPALRRAIAVVKSGKPALVDTVTQFR
jgi:acetolactate synthase-1/2/3 large subunit